MPECFRVSDEILVKSLSFWRSSVRKFKLGRERSGKGESQSARALITPFSTSTSFKSCLEIFFTTSPNILSLCIAAFRLLFRVQKRFVRILYSYVLYNITYITVWDIKTYCLGYIKLSMLLASTGLFAFLSASAASFIRFNIELIESSASPIKLESDFLPFNLFCRFSSFRRCIIKSKSDCWLKIWSVFFQFLGFIPSIHWSVIIRWLYRSWFWFSRFRRLTLIVRIIIIGAKGRWCLLCFIFAIYKTL